MYVHLSYATEARWHVDDRRNQRAGNPEQLDGEVFILFYFVYLDRRRDDPLKDEVMSWAIVSSRSSGRGLSLFGYISQFIAVLTSEQRYNRTIGNL